MVSGPTVDFYLLKPPSTSSWTPFLSFHIQYFVILGEQSVVDPTKITKRYRQNLEGPSKTLKWHLASVLDIYKFQNCQAAQVVMCVYFVGYEISRDLLLPSPGRYRLGPSQGQAYRQQEETASQYKLPREWLADLPGALLIFVCMHFVSWLRHNGVLYLIIVLGKRSIQTAGGDS